MRLKVALLHLGKSSLVHGGPCQALAAHCRVQLLIHLDLIRGSAAFLFFFFFLSFD